MEELYKIKPQNENKIEEYKQEEYKKLWNKISPWVGGALGFLLGGTIMYFAGSVNQNRNNTKQEFNQIFLEEIGENPTNVDSAKFYWNHNIPYYITNEPGRGDVAHFSEIPYKEMKRIVNENNNLEHVLIIDEFNSHSRNQSGEIIEIEPLTKKEERQYDRKHKKKK